MDQLISLDDTPPHHHQQQQQEEGDGGNNDAIQSAEDLLADAFGSGDSAGNNSMFGDLLGPPHPDMHASSISDQPSENSSAAETARSSKEPGTSTNNTTANTSNRSSFDLNGSFISDSQEQQDEPIFPEAQQGHGQHKHKDVNQKPADAAATTATESKPGAVVVGGSSKPDDSEPMEKPFNFQEFLEKMRHESAFTLVQPVKTFIAENSHPIHNPQDAVPVVHDFLDSLHDDIQRHELWKGGTDADIDNACEGMEKYILSKLYRYYFQPSASDEAFEDQALADRMRMLSFIKPEHLEIPPACLQYTEQLASAQTELIKMDSYKAPRDKAICILNCVKLIMSVLEMTSSETGADAFIPLLTYVILQAQPPNLISNLKYIERFRSPVKLRGEMAYYLTNMMVCMEFIKTADASRFNIDADEFEEQLTRQLEEMHPTPAKPRMEKPTRPPPPPPRGVTVKTISAADGGGDTDGGDDTRDRTDTITPAARSGRVPAAVNAIPSTPSSAHRSGAQSPTTAVTAATATPMALMGRAGDAIATTTHVPLVPVESAPVFAAEGDGGTSGTAAHAQPQAHAHVHVQPPHAAPPQQQQQQSSRGHGERTQSEDFSELVGRASVPAIERFRVMDVSQLTMADIPMLLNDYKRLAALNDDLTKTLNLNLGL